MDVTNTEKHQQRPQLVRPNRFLVIVEIELGLPDSQHDVFVN
jgi:hypothetical protein